MEQVSLYSLDGLVPPSYLRTPMNWARRRVPGRLGILGLTSSGATLACANLYEIKPGASASLYGARMDLELVSTYAAMQEGAVLASVDVEKGGQYGERRFVLRSKGREIAQLSEAATGGLQFFGCRVGGGYMYNLKGRLCDSSYGPVPKPLALRSPRLTLRSNILSRSILTLRRSSHRRGCPDYQLVTLFVALHVASYLQWDLDRS